MLLSLTVCDSTVIVSMVSKAWWHCSGGNWDVNIIPIDLNSYVNKSGTANTLHPSY